MIAEMCRGSGRTVELTPGGPDGGRDIIVRMPLDLVVPSREIYVEVKHHWADRVGRPVIQKLVGAGVMGGASLVAVVTPHEFARTVKSYVESSELSGYIRLVDGQRHPEIYRGYLAGKPLDFS